MQLFIQLVIVHLVVDFIFYPTAWSNRVNTLKLRSPYFYVHIVLHGLLSWLMLWNVELWWVMLLVSGSHGAIELARLYLRPRFTYERIPFFLGQGLHLVVLAFLSHYLNTGDLWGFNLPDPDWALVAAIIFVTQPTAVLMGLLMEGMAVKIPTDHKSLPRAGKYIGILERLFVLTFILLGRWDAIGLLITAKSVFRFNDLKESNNRKLTEYILIGTLMSFGFAIVTGLAYNYLNTF